MTCLTPGIKVRKHQTHSAQFRAEYYPCGKCPACIRRRIQHWVLRLEHENKIAENSTFVTLTYDDQNLPYTSNGNMTLVKEHWQLFFKRLRKFTEKQGIKYYAVGEYGDETHRPHYHAIIFNLPKSMVINQGYIQGIWNKGHIQQDQANQKTIAYTAGYVNKKLYKTREVEELDDREQEFSLMSKGLGHNYLTPQMLKYLRTEAKPYLTIQDGKKVALPRYYKDKIFNTVALKRIYKQNLLKYLEENPDTANEKDKLERIERQFEKQYIKNRDNRKKL